MFFVSTPPSGYCIPLVNRNGNILTKNKCFRQNSKKYINDITYNSAIRAFICSINLRLRREITALKKAKSHSNRMEKKQLPCFFTKQSYPPIQNTISPHLTSNIFQCNYQINNSNHSGITQFPRLTGRDDKFKTHTIPIYHHLEDGRHMVLFAHKTVFLVTQETVLPIVTRCSLTIQFCVGGYPEAIRYNILGA